MSDSVKLIIEIPKIDKELLDAGRCGETRKEAILHAVKIGTPLDSVKTEIFDKSIIDASGEGSIFLSRLLRIFDNVGKAESEGAECS